MLLPCQSLTEGCLMTLSELDLTIEEADVLLVPHVIHATQTGAKRLVILSGDTDVMVLALYFNTDLKTNDLSELWMHAGVGDYTRYIPLHLIFVGNQSHVEYTQKYTFLQAVTQLAKLEPNYLL